MAELKISPRIAHSRRGIENEVVPALALREFLLAVEVVGHEKRHVEKRLAEVRLERIIRVEGRGSLGIALSGNRADL